MRGPIKRLRMWRLRRRAVKGLEESVVGHMTSGEDTVASVVARLEAMGLHVTSAYAVDEKIHVHYSHHWGDDPPSRDDDS